MNAGGLLLAGIGIAVVVAIVVLFLRLTGDGKRK